MALTTKYQWAFFMLAFFKPKVFLNGQEIATNAWGRQVWTVSPGQHQLHVHVPYIIPSQIGKADVTVPVSPGQTVEVEYKAPLWVFSGGALGPPPQKYPAAGITIGLLIAFVVFICGCCCLSLLVSTSA
ncbi:hypothetical protein JQS43_09520 [Natronosporangium hydrolyticum]|uniref:Uncharacterized protein n=1 Tax=Natronosporangium hydrolyticum TaxID=2811111 RepID=A0A895YHA5_9ACTN|nr:hypothetical protein JQS43_09520 [Natronosporangium hydrolyticum]